MRYDYEAESGAKEQFDLEIRNELTEINRIIDAFEEYAEKVSIPLPVTMKVNLVFDELLNNINTDLSVDDREIGGLGIHLVKNVMDEFSYERHLDSNVVTLIKRFGN